MRFTQENVKDSKEVLESLNALVDLVVEGYALKTNLEPVYIELDADKEQPLEPSHRLAFFNLKVTNAATLEFIEHPERPCPVFTTIHLSAYLDDTLTLELDSISEVIHVSHGGSNKHNRLIVLVKLATGWEILSHLKS